MIKPDNSCQTKREYLRDNLCSNVSCSGLRCTDCVYNDTNAMSYPELEQLFLDKLGEIGELPDE